MNTRLRPSPRAARASGRPAAVLRADLEPRFQPALDIEAVHRKRADNGVGDRLIDHQNRALLAVAYDAMLRRTELVSLQVADLLEEMQGDESLLVRRSKTDNEGRGEIAWVGSDTVRLVRAWLIQAGIEEGMLFRSVAKGGRVGERLHPCRVPRIFKAMAR